MDYQHLVLLKIARELNILVYFVFKTRSILDSELKAEKEQRQSLQLQLQQEGDATSQLKTQLQQRSGLEKVNVQFPVLRWQLIIVLENTVYSKNQNCTKH